MTKRVRIENADTGKDVRLVAELIEVDLSTKNDFGVNPERVISTIELNNPTDMIEIFVWDNRYIKIREA
jgi:hypothetical protein